MTFKNSFDLFMQHGILVEHFREICENEIKNYVNEIWNPKLEYYVECEDTDIISIMVCDDEIDRKRFEQFIIEPICKQYGLNVRYVEILESSLSPYIEWGLGK